MKRTLRACAAVAMVVMPLAGCAPHLKKLDNATRGPYRYANPNGVSLPEQPVPSTDDMTPRSPAPVLPNAVPTPAPSASPAPPPASPTNPGVPGTVPPPRPRGNEGAMLGPRAQSGAATHA